MSWFFTRNGNNHDSSKLETMDQVGLFSRNYNDPQNEFTLEDGVNHLSPNGGFMHNENGNAFKFVAPTPKE